MAKSFHLSEYFKAGEPFELKIPDTRDPENEIVFNLWLQKPNPLQQEEAMKKGRAKQARIKQQYRNEESDEYLSLTEEIVQLGSVDELVDTLVQIEQAKLRQQAYQEVLYSEEVGSDWGDGGDDYLSILEAISDRYTEIVAANEALSEEDQHLAIVPEKDEEMQRLQETEQQFEQEVEERTEKLVELERSKLLSHSVEALRKMMFRKMVDTESAMAWMQEYQMRMLFAACRQEDNHNRFYFKSIEDIWELPDFVQSRLQDAFDSMSGSLDDIKNSPSLPLS